MNIKSGFSIFTIFFVVALLAVIGGVVDLVVFRNSELSKLSPIKLDKHATASSTTGSALETVGSSSYLLIETSTNVKITVFGPNNEEIIGYSYVENPIGAGDGSGEVSGEPLNVFSYPKPQYGKYLVNISGEGIYILDASVIGKDGEIFNNTFKRELKLGEVDELTIDLSKDNGKLKVSFVFNR